MAIEYARTIGHPGRVRKQIDIAVRLTTGSTAAPVYHSIWAAGSA